MNVRALWVVVSLALLSACDQDQGTTEAAKAPENQEVASVLRQLTADPQFAWLSTMLRLYPEEYQIVEKAMQAEVDGGADLLAARIALAETLKPMMRAHKQAVQKASDDHLVEYLRRNTRVAEALLVQDVKACTDVFRGNLDPETELPDATWKLMSDSTAQLLIAAHAAETRPVEHGILHLSPVDFQRWRIGMESVGADADTFAIISDPARKAAATASDLCRVRVQMMRGALKLPKPLIAKIALSVLSGV